jgi:hypothetical protein
MREYNLSPDGKNYYRQINNELSPSVTCKPTGTVEGLALSGWPLPQGKYNQAEDNLTALCRSSEGQTVLARLCPELNGNTAPNEVWQVIAWAINEQWYPTYRPLIGPRWNWGISEALYGIAHGVPFVASTHLTVGGHVVTIVGYTTDQDSIPASAHEVDLSKVKEIIIDDPYGDRTGGKYDTKKTGWNNRYPYTDFLRVWRGIGVQIRPRG